MKSMNDLMLHFLQDIYGAEKTGFRGLAKLARSVENQELKDVILQHRDQSQTQLSRLERVFEMMNKRPRSKPCAAMEGLSDEVDEAIEDGEKGPVLDAALIAGAQAVEHYEIARYGAMVAWARTLGMDEAAELLQQTLDEEKQSDARLNEIAERALNREAAESGAEDEDGEPAESGRGKGRARKPAARRGRTARAESEAAAAEEGSGDQGVAEPEAEEKAPRRRAAASRAKPAEKPAEKPKRAPARKPAARRTPARK